MEGRSWLEEGGKNIACKFIPFKSDVNFFEHLVSEIMNLQVGVYHLRPLNQRVVYTGKPRMGIKSLATDPDSFREYYSN